MTQQITPQLRQWIVEQAQAGHQAEAVLKSMLASGWAEDVAVEAMESTLRGHLEEKSAQQGLPPAIAVPDLALDESPLYVDAGDRRVHVLNMMVNPRIVVLGDLLSDQECDELIELAKPRLARSLTVATKTGGEEVNDDRTSSGMFFQRGEHEVVRRLEARLARLLNWPEENGEGLQILHYLPGAEKGGGTTFPDVNLVVAPKRGNAVFFSYDRAHPVTRTLHGGAPVLAGEKWIATKWLRERRFE
jgi:prolyl 4-hydroxylase